MPANQLGRRSLSIQPYNTFVGYPVHSQKWIFGFFWLSMQDLQGAANAWSNILKEACSNDENGSYKHVVVVADQATATQLLGQALDLEPHQGGIFR